ncbi:hypothetical protein CMQ_977 [Grosmannia clavigera kw1407]|uniref:Family c-likeg-protein-coupled receptor protein n=1 Tax=Grosmannia clavigera (strain kw1407 / UAMH 11150) TaxID=655863 RepID=F0XFI0_GROCL|nr:uncharacterized protein CMQ_977 [Grosmannia clavigera kw1407]EFX04049.1 hypothetical protein CMQ_977 [Grosmannia clavigera kw1407]
MSAHTTLHPPYASTQAGLGGLPTPKVDIAICAVLLLFFAVGAATNMTIFQINRRRDHRFLFSAMTFGFCMMRIVALVMRIVWATRPTNVSIAIAASIFTLAGVIILFIINLLFTQRLVRAYRPRLGWSRPVTVLFRGLIASIPACLIMLIIVTVHSFFTLSANAHRMERDVQLVGSTYYAFLAFLPMPAMLLTLAVPPRPPHHGPVENFGRGRLATKVRLLVFTSFLLALGAGFRCGIAYDPRPRSSPAWYHSKACYYCFNFVIEIIVVYTYTISRFDRRFHVPNGSSGPGHYSADSSDRDLGSVAAGPDGLSRKRSLVDLINTEADVFGSDTEPSASGRDMEQRAQDWDAQVARELQLEKEGQAV